MPSMAETFRALQTKGPTPVQQWVEDTLPYIQNAIQDGFCKNRFAAVGLSNVPLCKELVTLLMAEPYNFEVYLEDCGAYEPPTIHISW